MRRVTSLNQGWQFCCASWLEAKRIGFSDIGWQAADVPGHVHTDLMACGVIADPFERLHELGCQWIDEADWQYRTTFDFVPEPNLPRRVLRFGGLDTVCRVYLNGQCIGTHDDMFVELELDVTQRLLSGLNELRIEFDSARRIGRERRERYFEAQRLPPTTARFDERAFVRKSQYMYGWDWGPCLLSAGVWKPVEIVEYQARILDVHVEQQHQKDGSVDLVFTSEVDGSGTLYHFVEGCGSPVRDGERLRIQNPRLWWPNGLGKPELYRMVSILTERPPTSMDDLVGAHDVRQQQVGVRTVTLVREPDAHGEPFRFTINGRDLFAFGANWIPDDSFPSRVGRARLERQLTKAHALGMNMLRVWGGGLYESDDFYELCDSLGLLVWQDFPYACSYYPDDAEAREQARKEARSAILRLRNHASLAIWCGNNENTTMREGGWEGADRHPPRHHGERIYDEVLPRVLSELDPGRPYIPTSPFGKERANSGGDGDQHYWDVWHGRGDWKHYVDSDARFCSEFGFASAPSARAWLRMDSKWDLALAAPADAVARWHDKTGKGYSTFVEYVELHYPKSTNLREWTYYSQLNQRDALRFAIEHYRRGDRCRGALIWQLNDCWPVQSWALVDSTFQFKAAAYELKRLFAPVLASLERREDQLHLWGISDNVAEPARSTFDVEVRSLLDGTLLSIQRFEVELLPGERRILSKLDIAPYEATTTIVSASVGGYTTHVLLCEPKQVKLQPAELAVRRATDGILLRASRPIIDLYLEDPNARFEFAENFVSLVTTEPLLLRGRGELSELTARSLLGEHTVELEG